MAGLGGLFGGMPGTGSQQQQQSGSGGGQQSSPVQQQNNSKTILYIVIALLVVVIIVVVALPSLSSLTGPSVTQTKSLNATPTYMSAAQAQTLLGSSPSNYSTSDIFNTASLLNASDVVGAIPQLYNNFTSGWVTSAAGSNSSLNATLLYIVLTANQPKAASVELSAYFISSLYQNETSSSSGSVGAFNYTYASYANTTAVTQMVYGYKGNSTVLLLLYGNPGYSANSISAINLAAGDAPLR